MDSTFGYASSLMLRLNFGLTGCLAIAIAFPFLPTCSETSLLSIVAVAGTVSAISLSTSYQLVQWFRKVCAVPPPLTHTHSHTH